MITQSEFNRLADEGYNRIPLTAEAFADLETPLSLYLKLARGTGDGRNSFLLESVVEGILQVEPEDPAAVRPSRRRGRRSFRRTRATFRRSRRRRPWA